MSKTFSKAKVNYRKPERRTLARDDRRQGRAAAREALRGEIDPQNPPICEEDGVEMELGMDPVTEQLNWRCPECGWGYETEA